ncbi:hypothetical protein [Mangrovimonas cancribranchiae]|uniref:Outer membrane protein beta-barrel domain-containing protein n=1 Tax=Mangrovimonas cancribranchiae TaxID=3080055 RepID=A0AAU6P4X9_9FLAO
MNTITKLIVPLILCLSFTFVKAQDTLQSQKVDYKIEYLQESIKQVTSEEKALLKQEVEAINKRLENGEITQEKSDALKQQAAEKRALNIENRIAIIENKIALLERNEEIDFNDEESLKYVFKIGKNEDSDAYDRGVVYFGEEEDYKLKPRKYDRRTTSDLVFAIGFNNAIIEGESLNDSPYKLGGSGFVELGWAWKTRVFKNTNALRVKYGMSFQWNKLDIKDDKYLYENDEGIITLQEFPHQVRKSKFRTTNLVFPVHFEFGPSKKIEKEDYFRYSTYHKFKFGIGGYAGFNIGSLQKVKYKLDGNREKDKYKSYNTNNIVYGLSAYAGFGNVGIYAKYDLNPIFKDQAIDQNNISLGLRFDLD